MTTLEDYVHALRLATTISTTLRATRFSRNEPTHSLQIEARIREAILEHHPIRFLGLWGGSKEGVYGDHYEMQSLEFISQIKAEVVRYSPATFSLLFGDMHHVLVNGSSYAETEEYYTQLVPLVHQQGLDMVKLSDWYGNRDIDCYTHRCARIQASRVIANQEALRRLKRAAQRHSRLLQTNQNDFTAEEIARIYVEVEIYFLQRIAEEHKSLFFSLSDPVIQCPIAEAAQIPMFYFHAAGKGHHDCPWYSKV
ncbi:hypothetical protein HYW21_04975 [Candidatus Woesearchaeota archaeon]|nr:hypothetical protein [Candidatus Woesearchaeota archaeon]